MSIENRPNAPEQQLHPGIVPIEEGGERPVPGAQPLENIDTGELEALTPETPFHGFESLPPTEQEKAEFDQARASRRDLETTSEVTEKKGKGKLIAAIGGVAAIGVTAATLFLMPKGDNNHKENAPTPTQPVATAEAHPTASAETDTAKSLEIPAGLEPLALGKKIASIISEWQMAGATPELYQSWDPSVSVEDYTKKIATEQGKKYAVALFGPDYEANPDILAFVQKSIDMNAADLNAYIRTFDRKANSKNLVPYEIHSDVLSVLSSSKDKDTTSLELQWRDTNNGNMNTIGERSGMPPVVDGVAHIKTKTVGNVDYIQAISFN